MIAVRVIATIALMAGATTGSHAAKILPPEVQANINEAMAACGQKPGFQKGFIERKDVNGDGKTDYILDYARFACGDSVSSFCGSAGCMVAVFASTQAGLTKVLDSNVQHIKFNRSKGMPAMTLSLHGSACGRSGFEQCRSTTYWNGSAFTPAR